MYDTTDSAAEVSAGARRALWRTPMWWVTWVAPLVAAVVILGPALAPGSLFNLDLVLVPRLEVPNGFWGLGPELPRRLPLWVPISWLSPIIPATVSGKVLMVAVFVFAWAGAVRLATRWGARWAPIAGALYALSPFLLTRTAIGHFMVTVPLAVLPWVLPTLLAPGRRLRLTFLASFALAWGGHFGGSVAMLIVVVAVLCGAKERWWQALVVALAAQSVWLVPSLVVASGGTASLASASAFVGDSHGLLGLLRLAAGGGFWNRYFQVGGAGVAMAVCGLVLVSLAAAGTSRLPDGVRRPMVVLAIVGWLVPAMSTMRGLSRVLVWFTGTSVGGELREPQRLLVVYLVWLAPAAVLGAQRVYEEAGRSATWLWIAGPAAVAPAAVALVLVAPGLWGIGGQLRAESLPAGWQQARATVRAEPGTVLALPWYQYFNQQLPGGPVRRVLDPMPLFLGGDVLGASNDGLEADVQERADPREPTASIAVHALITAHSPISGSLASLGVRWVVEQTSVAIDDYGALATDPGLQLVVDSPALRLYRVTGWVGAAVTADGRGVPVDTGAAWATIVDPTAVVWNRPAAAGWRRGGATAHATADGRLALPAGSGTVWNVGTVPALAGELGTVVAAVLCGWSWRRRRRPVTNEHGD